MARRRGERAARFAGMRLTRERITDAERCAALRAIRARTHNFTGEVRR